MQNEASTHTTLATWALAVERALQTEGADTVEIFKKANIDRNTLLETDARIPVSTMWQLWRAAVEITGNDAIGIRVAETLFPTHLNALMFAMQASETIQDCIERLSRYAKVVSTIGSIDVDYAEDVVCIRMISSIEPDRPYQPIDALLAVVVKVIRDILEPVDQNRILTIRLCRPTPEKLETFQRFFKCPIEFSASANEIILDKEILTARLASANSEMARVNDELLNDYLKRLNNESTSLKVRKQILKLMGSEHLNQEFIASRLNMSVRNLHRKLSDEGQNFKELLDSTRKELALRYLKMSNISIGELTFSLGFVDQSSFSRAFKRWTGKTPSQFRKQPTEK
ncbi:AraC family transcriptional regulator [Litoribrevibacter albus]|uniref:AraC family transcriptional regulator n=1 Tax=Litoribrevibacter albus TaxID=1473156 RepID=A0AA37S923_9GAMM|nr:AraC family transcriptional regulator [Litoribrevibacter albus]GLQ30438.1 AraC family transcriptional regulator [Litoribrevibacter albus]